MQNKKLLILFALVAACIITIFALGCENTNTTDSTEKNDSISASQYESYTPPKNMPTDHTGRWEQGGHNSSYCLGCHAPDGEDSAATTIPLDHYIDDDQTKELSGERGTCITCHVLDARD